MTALAPLTTTIPEAVLASQAAFRALMDAMARPGTLQTIKGVLAPQPLMPASAAMARALFDQDTPLWLDGAMAAAPEVAAWLTFHTNAPFASPATCAFALVADAATFPALETFNLGSDDYPDRATTLIVQVANLTEGPSVLLRGPGIDGTAHLRATLEQRTLLERLTATRPLFPRGLDVIFVAGESIVAVPRTTRLSAQGS